MEQTKKRELVSSHRGLQFHPDSATSVELEFPKQGHQVKTDLTVYQDVVPVLNFASYMCHIEI